MLKNKHILTVEKKNDTNVTSPIVINLFGGPGCGKSTAAAYIFSKLKMYGINCELVTEFAKDKTWEHNLKALNCQPYVFGKQCYRMDRCADQVEVIVTDSPLLLTILYNKDKNIEPEFTQVVLKKFHEFENCNFLLNRKKKYNPKGRNQTEEEAKELDAKISSMLNRLNIYYDNVEGSIEGCDQIIYMIRKILDNNNNNIT